MTSKDDHKAKKIPVCIIEQTSDRIVFVPAQLSLKVKK